MKLIQYLSDHQKSPTTFAGEIGVPPSTITRLIKGERSPGLDLIGKIVVATGGTVTAADFLEAAASRQTVGQEGHRLARGSAA